MFESPKVSVLMSVHNGQSYLQPAIDSLLNQTEKNLELIVINDGSTDNTAEILTSYAKADSRVRVYNQESKGLTKSLNIAFGHSQGEFIARMDADDISNPKRFESQLDYLKKHPSCVAVGTSLILIDPDGDPIGSQTPPLVHDEIQKKLLKGHGALPHPSAMIRRTALAEISGYDETLRYAQDLDLWLRLSEVGELANLEVPLLQYRLHANSITSGKRNEQLRCARLAVEKACTRRNLPMDSLPELQGGSDETATETEEQWIAMATASGNFKTAEKYVWKQVARNPFSLSRWKKILRLRRTAKSYQRKQKINKAS